MKISNARQKVPRLRIRHTRTHTHTHTLTHTHTYIHRHAVCAVVDKLGCLQYVSMVMNALSHVVLCGAHTRTHTLFAHHTHTPHTRMSLKSSSIKKHHLNPITYFSK